MTYTELTDPAVAALAPALAQAARTVGSPQIRNAGTVGGNLGTGSPAGDTLPVLAALDAVVELVSVTGSAPLPDQRVLHRARSAPPATPPSSSPRSASPSPRARRST